MDIKKMVLAALFAALTAIGAFLTVPLEPVPFTFQVFFVLLAGTLLGTRYGVLSQATYIMLGMVAPVYSGGASGPGVLFGPRGGYLFGFVVAAYIVGLITRGGHQNEKVLIRYFIAMLAGVVTIHLGGIISLMLVLEFNFSQALMTGAVFFLLDILKACLAAPLALKLRKYL
ncbi:MAG TPA: biotin transporter BioY [Firmicutes bacterium]|nr:biotin transporter BioY [Bacillota bacterium]